MYEFDGYRLCAECLEKMNVFRKNSWCSHRCFVRYKKWVGGYKHHTQRKCHYKN